MNAKLDLHELTIHFKIVASEGPERIFPNAIDQWLLLSLWTSILAKKFRLNAKTPRENRCSKYSKSVAGVALIAEVFDFRIWKAEEIGVKKQN